MTQATIRSSLQIKVGELEYQSKPTDFKATVTGSKGPVPGAMSISTAGTDIDFSELVQPALCRFMNLDSTNFVEWGVWDPENTKFFPVGEILAGETYVIRLSRNIQEEFDTGTGTTGANTNRLRFKADTAAVDALVEAFEV